MPLGFLIGICVLLHSCSLDDERDECCQAGTVRFRYLYVGMDRFADYVKDMRYLLFDGEGRYLHDMPPTDASLPNKVRVDMLAGGDYTLVGVGNLDDYASLEGYAEEGLEAFRLRVDQYSPHGDGTFANGDRLYWGECRFMIVPGAFNGFLGEMANVHCVLRLRVEWERVPEFSEGYRFRLEGVGRGMEMHGGNAKYIDVQAFPPVESYGGSMTEDVPLRQFALQAELVTLRWTDAEIPSFRLMHGDEFVTKSIDLGRAFRQWGWHPDRAPVQEYELRMLVRANGSIEVNQGLRAGVGDWENGGVIGF